MRRKQATKRANGEGSIKQLSNGRYKATFTIGFTADGKAIRRSTNGKSREEALRRMRDKQEEIRLGHPVVSGTETVEHYLVRWLEDRARPAIRESTYRRHKITLDSVYPHIGHLKLVDLRPAHIQKMYAELGRTQKPPTIARTHGVLHQAFEGAVEWDIIPKNPTTYVRPPKVEKIERVVLSREDGEKLFAATANHPLGALWVVLATLGLRIGEALALTWDDVSDTELQIRKGKTVNAPRPVPLPQNVVEALNRRKAIQREQKIRNRDVWRDDLPKYVFSTRIGTPIAPMEPRRFLRAALEKAGLPPMRVHDLRRTAIAWMREAGVEIDVVQKIVGHARIATTIDVYGSVNRKRLEDAREKLGLYVSEGGR